MRDPRASPPPPRHRPACLRPLSSLAGPVRRLVARPAEPLVCGVPGGSGVLSARAPGQAPQGQMWSASSGLPCQGTVGRVGGRAPSRLPTQPLGPPRPRQLGPSRGSRLQASACQLLGHPRLRPSANLTRLGHCPAGHYARPGCCMQLQRRGDALSLTAVDGTLISHAPPTSGVQDPAMPRRGRPDLQHHARDFPGDGEQRRCFRDDPRLPRLPLARTLSSGHMQPSLGCSSVLRASQPDVPPISLKRQAARAWADGQTGVTSAFCAWAIATLSAADKLHFP